MTVGVCVAPWSKPRLTTDPPPDVRVVASAHQAGVRGWGPEQGRVAVGDGFGCELGAVDAVEAEPARGLTGLAPADQEPPVVCVRAGAAPPVAATAGPAGPGRSVPGPGPARALPRRWHAQRAVPLAVSGTRRDRRAGSARSRAAGSMTSRIFSRAVRPSRGYAYGAPRWAASATATATACAGGKLTGGSVAASSRTSPPPGPNCAHTGSPICCSAATSALDRSGTDLEPRGQRGGGAPAGGGRAAQLLGQRVQPVSSVHSTKGDRDGDRLLSPSRCAGWSSDRHRVVPLQPRRPSRDHRRR